MPRTLGSLRLRVETLKPTTTYCFADMDVISLCHRYQLALTNRDLGAIEALFVDDALITGPISGTVGVRQFHEYLFAKTKRSMARFGNIIRHQEKQNSVTLPFSYTLSIASGAVTALDGIMVVGFDASAEKIRSLTIIYDHTELRRLMADAGIEPPPGANPAPHHPSLADIPAEN